MGGTRYTKREQPYDYNYLTNMNNMSGGNFASSVPPSDSKPGQFVKTKQGVFNGTFGSVAEIEIFITGGVLPVNVNATGSTVIKRVVFVKPSPSSDPIDTMISIDTGGVELPYQEMILLGTSGKTITITHNGVAVSTSKTILCPGDTDYTLSGDEAVYLIYNTILGKWIITNSATSSGTTSFVGFVGDAILDMGGFNITNFNDIIAGIGDRIFFDGGSDTYVVGSLTSGRIDVFSNTANVAAFTTSGFLTTNITCANLTTTGTILAGSTIDLNGNALILSADGTSKIDAVGNTMIVTANSSEVFRYTSSGIDMKTDIDMATGTTIDWTSAQSTVGSAGGASALPATPTGYIVIKLGGTEYVVPYYAKT